MKIALMLSGQPRYIKECFSSIKQNLLDLHDVDIYAHFWWDKSYIGQKFKFHALDTYKENMGKVFLDTYGEWIKEVKFEKQPNFNLSFLDFNSGEQADQIGDNREMWCKEVAIKQMCMWSSMRKSFDMVQNDKYDYYIRARTDLILNQPLELEKYQNNSLYIDEFENKSQLCDWFAGSKDIQYLRPLMCATTYNKSGSVITSTSIFKRSLSLNPWCNLEIVPFNVNIYRGYQQPIHMNQYSPQDQEKFPYWMK